jgi:hypothetical protein
MTGAAGIRPVLRKEARMRRLRIVFRGGATVDVDISDDWNFESDLMKFPPPSELWSERLRYISTAEVVAIAELRSLPDE